MPDVASAQSLKFQLIQVAPDRLEMPPHLPARQPQPDDAEIEAQVRALRGACSPLVIRAAARTRGRRVSYYVLDGRRWLAAYRKLQAQGVDLVNFIDAVEVDSTEPAMDARLRLFLSDHTPLRVGERDALLARIPERLPAVPKVRVTKVKPSSVVMPMNHPQREVDSDLDGLKRNISSAGGVVRPIIVRPDRASKGDFILLHGRRRLVSAVELQNEGQESLVRYLPALSIDSVPSGYDWLFFAMLNGGLPFSAAEFNALFNLVGRAQPGAFNL